MGISGAELQELVEAAIEDPANALARLYLAIADDHGLFEESRQVFAANENRYLARSEAVFKAVEEGCPPADLEPGDALAVLSALDRYRSEQYPVSHSPQPARVRLGDHEPEVWVQPRPRGWCPAIARQPNQLLYWMPRHWVYRGTHAGIRIRPRFGADLADLQRRLDEALKAGQLRCWVGGFLDDVDPDWEHTPPRYGAERLKNASLRWESLRAMLEAAAADKAHVLVLPELTVTPALRDEVAAWLCTPENEHTFLVVVPGSFHVGPAGERCGEAVLLDSHGNVRLRHRKLKPMMLDDHEGMPQVREEIRGHSELNLVASPLGPIAIGICLDFCDLGLAELWRQAGPGLVLVPSMSNAATTDAHHRRASALHAEHGTTSVVAIQPTDDGVRYGLVVGEGAKRFIERLPSTSGFCGEATDVACPQPPYQPGSTGPCG